MAAFAGASSVDRRVERIVHAKGAATLVAEIRQTVFASARRGELEYLENVFGEAITRENHEVTALSRRVLDVRSISTRSYRLRLQDTKETLKNSIDSTHAEATKINAGSRRAEEAAQQLTQIVEEANGLKVYNLAFQLGRKCSASIASEQFEVAIPAFRSLERIVKALSLKRNKPYSPSCKLDTALMDAYTALEENIERSVLKLLDAFSMKIMVEAETVGDDLLKHADAERKELRSYTEEIGNNVPLRDSSWAHEETRRRRRSSFSDNLSNSGAPEDMGDGSITTGGQEDKLKAMFRGEISELKRFFSLYKTVCSSKEAVAEYTSRLKLDLSQLGSDIDLQPVFTHGRGNALEGLAQSNFLKDVIVLAKRIAYHFALEDTIQHCLRFYFLNEINILEKWEACEKDFVHFIKRGMQGFTTSDFKAGVLLQQQIFLLVEVIGKLHFFRLSNLSKPGYPCRALRHALDDFMSSIVGAGEDQLIGNLLALMGQTGSSVVGGMKISSVDELKALVHPFGLLTTPQQWGKRGELPSVETTNDTLNNAQMQACTFPMILPFSKKVSECAFTIDRFRVECLKFSFHSRYSHVPRAALAPGDFEPSTSDDELLDLVWSACWRGFDAVYNYFRNVLRRGSEYMGMGLSQMAQAAIDALHFALVVRKFDSIARTDFYFTQSAGLAESRSVDTTMSDKTVERIKSFERLALELQDEVVQMLCDKTRSEIAKTMATVALDARQKSNAVLSSFGPLVDFLATAFVNLMNLPKARKEAAMYLSMQQISGYIMDLLMGVTIEDDEIRAASGNGGKFTTAGLFNISLALTAVENFAVGQNVRDLDKVFIPLRNFIEENM